jgi:hypothetical protein
MFEFYDRDTGMAVSFATSPSGSQIHCPYFPQAEAVFERIALMTKVVDSLM